MFIEMTRVLMVYLEVVFFLEFCSFDNLYLKRTSVHMVSNDLILSFLPVHAILCGRTTFPFFVMVYPMKCGFNLWRKCNNVLFINAILF